MDSRVELHADGFDGLDVEAAEGVIHLFDNELHAGAELVDVAVGFEGEGEVIEYAEEGLDGGLDGVVADVLALFGFALAGIVELGLKAGEAVLRLRELKGELVTLVADVLEVEELADFRCRLRCRRGRFRFGRSVPSVRCSWDLPFCYGSFAASGGSDLLSGAWVDPVRYVVV